MQRLTGKFLKAIEELYGLDSRSDVVTTEHDFQEVHLNKTHQSPSGILERNMKDLKDITIEDLVENNFKIESPTYDVYLSVKFIREGVLLSEDDGRDVESKLFTWDDIQKIKELVLLST